MLDLENEFGHAACWGGLAKDAMVDGIKSLGNRYHAKAGRYPVPYTNPSWWGDCTGNSKAFGSSNPPMLAHHADRFKYGGDSNMVTVTMRCQRRSRGFEIWVDVRLP